MSNPHQEEFLPQPSHLYTERDIRRWFDDRTLSRARDYTDAIEHLTILPERITARVQGTEPSPYHVEIVIQRPNPRSITMESECSCPVGYNCKHAAATLFAALQAREAPPRANPDVMVWIEHLSHKKAALTLPPPTPRREGEAIHYLITLHQPPEHAVLMLYKGEIVANRLDRNAAAWSGF